MSSKKRFKTHLCDFTLQMSEMIPDMTVMVVSDFTQRQPMHTWHKQQQRQKVQEITTILNMYNFFNSIMMMRKYILIYF